jgi:hypothetical protein
MHSFQVDLTIAYFELKSRMKIYKETSIFDFELDRRTMTIQLEFKRIFHILNQTRNELNLIDIITPAASMEKLALHILWRCISSGISLKESHWIIRFFIAFLLDLIRQISQLTLNFLNGFVKVFLINSSCSSHCHEVKCYAWKSTKKAP